MAEFEVRTKCPHCGTVNPMATEVYGAREGQEAPEPGDVTLCIACGRWAIFDAKMRLHKPTREQMSDLARSFNLPAIHEAWVQSHSKP